LWSILCGGRHRWFFHHSVMWRFLATYQFSHMDVPTGASESPAGPLQYAVGELPFFPANWQDQLPFPDVH
jgi:hypothetical protein